jgi:hypothetical protein
VEVVALEAGAASVVFLVSVASSASSFVVWAVACDVAALAHAEVAAVVEAIDHNPQRCPCP